MAGKERQRLDKVLAHLGYGSRREIKKMVKAERVIVNGAVVRDPELHVFPWQDRIEVDGEPIHYREYIYLMMNKPQGVLSATEDAAGKVVVDLLRPEHKAFAPFPVGRLDKDTEGLLLLTNDGQLAHRLLAPKKHVPKRYYARVKGVVTDEDKGAFQAGITLDDGYRTLPAELTILHAGPVSEVELVIYEGKFHQVKRMFAARGKTVAYLKRLAMGALVLDEKLAPGEYRELTTDELASLGAVQVS